MGVDSKDNSIGSPLDGTDTASDHADAIGAVHERHGELEATLGNYHVAGLMDGADAASKHGHRTGRGPTDGAEQGQAAKEKKEKTASLYRSALKQLEDQIARLNDEIAALRRELGEIDDVMAAIREGRELPDTEAAQRLKVEYKRQTGKDYDPSDPDAQALLLQISQERRDVVEHQLNEKIRDRAHAQAELDRARGIETELVEAPTEEGLAQMVKDRPLADIATAAAQSESSELKTNAYEAIGLTQQESAENLLMEEISRETNVDTALAIDDASWFDAPAQPAASAASTIVGATRINDGGNVQPTFARAVAGETLPPGVESQVQTAEIQADTDGTALTQDSAPV